MKYLLIAALLILLLLLLYSRVHPYVKILKKILTTVRSVTGSQPGSTAGSANSVKIESKLVKCVGCDIWIPADRAIGAGRGGSIYCSPECLEKPQKQKETKLAG